ncbi:MAG TPA: universal stress protein [Planctomycetota bacterium]|nr:universal stress protein [Planctomycetota bacterium]
MKTSIDRILIPLDGSSQGDSALDAIGPLLRMHHPEVLLLGVMDEEHFDPKRRTHLDFTCNALRSKGVDASIALREGKDAATQILDFARERGVDLIAMSTHGRSGLSRIFVGSVTEEVLRRTEVPLLVCRPGAAVGEWDRIVVALDGSERAEEILPEAARIARAQKAGVDLVRVALPVVSAGGVGEFPLVFPAENPLPYLKAVSGRLQAEGVDARAVGLEGRAAFEILKYAKDNNAGLICMTTHGRTGVARVLLGSIAEEVLRHATCPVLLRRMARERVEAK